MRWESCGFKFSGTKICPSCGHGRLTRKPRSVAVSKNLATSNRGTPCNSCGYPLGASKVCPSCGHGGSNFNALNGDISNKSAEPRQITLYDSRGYQLDADESAKAGALLHKYLLILFWLFIPSLIGSVLSRFQSLLLLGTIISGVTSLAHAFVLFRLRNLDHFYRSAAKLTLCASLLSFIMIAVQWIAIFNDLPGLKILTLVITLIVMIISIVETYSEFNAHSNVSSSASNFISTQWDLLWKWYVGLIIAVIAVTILPIFLYSFSVIVLVLAIIGSIVVGIIRLVLLYRTAELFRK